MSLWEALLLGVVQGLTEFLPISSTAHLVFVRKCLGHQTPEDAFTTVIQLGTLVAVMAYYARDIRTLAMALARDLIQFRWGSTPESRLALAIVFGSLPVVLVGFLGRKFLKTHFYQLHAMAWVAILFALLMAASEWWAARRKRLQQPEFDEFQLRGWQVLWIGVWQALALMPGASRSGCTISAGLFAGLSRSAAARFSFLLSLPSILGAGLLDLVQDWSTLMRSREDIGALVLGLLVSAVVGYASIEVLLRFLKHYSMMGFVVYRLGLGILILILLACQILT